MAHLTIENENCNPEKCKICKAVARDLPPAQLFEFWYHCRREAGDGAGSANC